MPIQFLFLNNDSQSVNGSGAQIVSKDCKEKPLLWFVKSNVLYIVLFYTKVKQRALTAAIGVEECNDDQMFYLIKRFMA